MPDFRRLGPEVFHDRRNRMTKLALLLPTRSGPSRVDRFRLDRGE